MSALHLKLKTSTARHHNRSSPTTAHRDLSPLLYELAITYKRTQQHWNGIGIAITGNVNC